MPTVLGFVSHDLSAYVAPAATIFTAYPIVTALWGVIHLHRCAG